MSGNNLWSVVVGQYSIIIYMTRLLTPCLQTFSARIQIDMQSPRILWWSTILISLPDPTGPTFRFNHLLPRRPPLSNARILQPYQKDGLPDSFEG
jgi:hypothetical protein